MAANLQAVQRIEAWLEASIRAHQTVGVETVLSTGKYRRLVLDALSLGFQVWLTYVLLNSPERCIERVRLRVAKGGHDVPRDKVENATNVRSTSCHGFSSRQIKPSSTTIQANRPG